MSQLSLTERKSPLPYPCRPRMVFWVFHKGCGNTWTWYLYSSPRAVSMQHELAEAFSECSLQTRTTHLLLALQALLKLEPQLVGRSRRSVQRLPGLHAHARWESASGRRHLDRHSPQRRFLPDHALERGREIGSRWRRWIRLGIKVGSFFHHQRWCCLLWWKSFW